MVFSIPHQSVVKTKLTSSEHATEAYTVKPVCNGQSGGPENGSIVSSYSLYTD